MALFKPENFFIIFILIKRSVNIYALSSSSEAPFDIAFPNPRQEPKLCGRTKPSFICDPDRVLKEKDVDKLDFLTTDLYQSTACFCPQCSSKNYGVSIGIFIKYNFTTTRFTTDMRALVRKMRLQWKLGSCDDDISIILLAQLRKSQFDMGSQIEKVLSRKTAEEIFQKCIIHFENDNFLQGLESMINSFQDILRRLQQDKNKTPVSKETTVIIAASLGIAVAILIAFALFMFVRKKFFKKKRNVRRAESISKSESVQLDYKHRYKPCETEEKIREESSEDENDCKDVKENFLRMNESAYIPIKKRQLSNVDEETDEESVETALAILNINSKASRSTHVTEL